MAAGLPPDVAAAIADMLEGVSRKALAVRAARLSEGYRGGGGSAAIGTEDVLAYLVARMPATYAATAAALAAAAAAAPEFAPRSLLDVGAGPGTAAFAALATWPEIEAATTIDANRAFTAAAARLMAASAHAALSGATRILADAAAFGRDFPAADLVIAAYALAEIAERDRAPLVGALWKGTDGALVLVEPGTPDGFARIRAARALLIAEGAAIAAPCPHTRPCPIVAPDWCHFAERLPRSRDHRLAKGGEVPFEDEKYAYVVAFRDPALLATYDARVLAPPRMAKAGVELKLCTDTGTIAMRRVDRRDRPAFAVARRARWGDALSLPANEKGG